MRRETGARKRPRRWSKKRPRATDAETYWSGNYDELLDYWGDTSFETTAFALKLMVRQDRGSGLLPKAAMWLGKNRTASIGSRRNKRPW